MMTGEMTDNEVRQRVERADRFIEQLRDAITAPYFAFAEANE